MTEYHVEYRIEVDAESYEDAARKVAAILASGGAGRGVYYVNNHETEEAFNATRVDLSQIECNDCKRPAAEVGKPGYGDTEDLCSDCNLLRQGFTRCPQCDQWVRANEVETYQTPNGPVRMCSGCHHDARRSGADIS